ncbi:helix-turn-helix transcriptional regulator [Amorphus coralli]|uniref:helix-turn-helix transcriptional regulator n=1 Tax=Amorphus coralli TaxID=340680 RepID=UPI0003708DAE|nr:WYL domain-containing protein [Amorphus coralli]
MAYQKARDLLDLAIALAGSHYGLTAAEIEEHLVERGSSSGPSPKALERQRQRMLAQIEALFGPALRTETDDENRRRWTLRTNDLAKMPLVELADLVALDRAGELLAQLGDRDSAGRLDRLRNQLQMALDARWRARVEVDLEALREAQAVSEQPGPYVEIDPEVARVVSEAVLAGNCLGFDYRGPEKTTPREVEPVGVLVGPRSYLVARIRQTSASNGPGHWRMDRIIAPYIIDEPARPMPKGFTLSGHARRLFGTFWSEAEYEEVEWRFSPSAAPAVRTWRFHPDQTFQDHEDGSVTVRFRASGHLEMAWHLYQWGDSVEVIKPKAVADLVAGHQRPDFPALP